MILSGKALVLGDAVDTDVILPGKYLTIPDPVELGKHALEGLAADVGKVEPNTIVVAGTYFGCGSSREHAPVALKHGGVLAVVAASYARIFYRSAINIGLPSLECDTASFARTGDLLKVDLEAGIVQNLSSGATRSFKPLPEFLMAILDAGGLIAKIKSEK